jgi:hypothetical protein
MTLSGPPSGNRRASRRKGLRGPCVLRLDGQPEREAQLFDIGIDGVSLVTARPVPPGSRGELVFTVPSGSAQSAALARVRTVYSSYLGPGAGFRIGAVFASLDEALAERLRSFVSVDP